MTISESSRIIRWAYFPERMTDKRLPYTTTLCAVFWRCVLGVPIFCIFATAIVVTLSPIFAGMWIVERTKQKQRAADLLQRAKDSRLVELAGAVKGRICPAIYVEHEERVRIGSR